VWPVYCLAAWAWIGIPGQPAHTDCDMRAMVLERPREALRLRTLPPPKPQEGQLLIEVAACAVCRTDLHIVDGELPNPKLPLILGHEIVGRVTAVGPAVEGFHIGGRSPHDGLR
jgi:propanol-preferring alcohol dehydrogenase